jgi:TPR repeat protein
MRPKTLSMIAWLALAFATAQSQAAVSLNSDGIGALPAEADGPAKAAMQAFRDGQHAKAVEMATPLAETGNGDALFLLGFAHETGQGAEPLRELAIDYYTRASAAGHKDATYRASLILLASEVEAEREKARDMLEAAAKSDPAVAGRILGEAYLRGRISAEPDYEKTLYWWGAAADSGDVPAILLLARLHEGQFGFPEKKNLQKAMTAYAKAAGLGDGPAMAAYGSRLLSGEKEFRDEAKGREWLKKAIEAGEHAAFLALGDFEENVKNDPKAALAFYERGKDAGQIDSTIRAANFYIEGKGTEKDVPRGIQLLETAAKNGSALAHFQLAVHRLSGDVSDMTPGYGHLVAAANGGLLEAQNELGLLYLSGRIGAADPAAGVAWLTRAAQGGFAQAQNNLATLYERGAGVPQNLNNAGQLYSLAANQGHGPATLALARMHFQGLGTQVNLEKAWALATLAAERGEEGAKKLVEEIGGKLDEPKLAAARKELEAMKSATPAASAGD